jgi:hypothetical protein
VLLGKDSNLQPRRLVARPNHQVRRRNHAADRQRNPPHLSADPNSSQVDSVAGDEEESGYMCLGGASSSWWE